MSAAEYVSRRQASEITGFKEDTLAHWACLGKGPKFVKYGKGRGARVRYPLSDLLEFMRRGEMQPTNQSND